MIRVLITILLIGGQFDDTLAQTTPQGFINKGVRIIQQNIKENTTPLTHTQEQLLWTLEDIVNEIENNTNHTVEFFIYDEAVIPVDSLFKDWINYDMVARFAERLEPRLSLTREGHFVSYKLKDDNELRQIIITL